MRNTNKKVAFFIPSLTGGGAERVFLNFANELSKKGFIVDMILVNSEIYYKNIHSNVRIVDLKSKRVLFSLPALIKYLYNDKPYILFSALEHANIIAILAKIISFSSTRIVVTIHNTLSIAQKESNLLRVKLIPLLVKVFYRFAFKIIAVSKGVAMDFSELTKIPNNKIKVIYNPVITTDLFIKANEHIEHPWFNHKDKPIVIGIGRLVKQKNFPLLINAFALVKQKIDCRLVILGEGEDRILLEKLITDLNLNNYVRLLGFVENPYKYIKNSDLFVLSSIYEGLPTVLIESLALGVPVVSTDCPSGPSEIINSDGMGILVPVDNHILLSDAIVKSLKKPQKVNTNKLRIYTLEYSINAYIEECNL